MKKTLVNSLVIEITRKCNMTCDHCFRGTAQNKNINIDYVEKLFKQISEIHTLTLTGGEPSLNVDAINQIVDLAEKHKIAVNNFYLVTNAKLVTDEFMKAILRLHLFCLKNNGGYDEEIKSLSISNDGYHSEVEKENINKLLAFRFASLRNEKSGQMMDFNSIIYQGNAIENGIGSRQLNLYSYEVENNEIMENDVYLNVNGDLIPNCNLSYDSQEDHKFGNVNDLEFNLLRAVKYYNKMIEKNEENLVCN